MKRRVLGVGFQVLGKTDQHPAPNTQHPFFIHPSSLLSYFPADAPRAVGCSFSLLRPEGCPSVVAISPVSINCLKRRRSSSICCSGFSPKRRATRAPSLPPGGSYLRMTRTTVPRPPAGGSK